MDLDQLQFIVANNLFPIAITTYLLVRFEKQMKEMTIAIKELTLTCFKCCANGEKR